MPGDKKFLKKVYTKADKVDDEGKDGKVTFENALAVFTKALEVESEDEVDPDVDPDDDGSAEEDDSHLRCFVDKIFGKK